MLEPFDDSSDIGHPVILGVLAGIDALDTMGLRGSTTQKVNSCLLECTQTTTNTKSTTKTTNNNISSDKNDQGSESHSHTKRPTTGDRCQQLLHEILGFHKNAHQCKPIGVYLSNSGILNI